MNKEVEVFSPLLTSFCKDVQSYKGKVDTMSGVFLPHTLTKYSTAEKKYFYCGQDTNWWIPFDKMIQYYENDNIKGYIEENNSIQSIDDKIKYSNNKEGNFWTLVLRLHIYLHRHEFINIKEISENDKLLFQEMGYGNINAIELPKSLDNEGRWDSLNQEIYWRVKEKSKVFDSLSFILDIYEPDYIFIFNWDRKKQADFVKELNLHWNENETWLPIISTYNLDRYKTKLIWCPHPNNLRFHDMNINELIEEIIIRL